MAAEKDTVPVKFVAVSVTVTEPLAPRFTVTAAALNAVCTEPMVSCMVAVWPGKAVVITLDVPASEIE